MQKTFCTVKQNQSKPKSSVRGREKKELMIISTPKKEKSNRAPLKGRRKNQRRLALCHHRFQNGFSKPRDASNLEMVTE